MFFRDPKAGWLLWGAGLTGLIVLATQPYMIRAIRLGCAALLLALWLGLFALVWKRRVIRWSLLGLSLALLVFLSLPGQKRIDAEALRARYVAALNRYNGVRYFWGGESFLGIDCSGLLRRSMIDASLAHGMETGNPYLIRFALALWWNDATASAMGEGYSGWTEPVAEASSIGVLDHGRLLPGDMAVTRSGIHIMGCLSPARWIEADPAVGRVITVDLPTENQWFHTPIRIVRWTLLKPEI